MKPKKPNSFAKYEKSGADKAKDMKMNAKEGSKKETMADKKAMKKKKK